MMPSDIWTAMLTNNLDLGMKERFREVARVVSRYAVTAIYENRERRIQKRFSVL